MAYRLVPPHALPTIMDFEISTIVVRSSPHNEGCSVQVSYLCKIVTLQRYSFDKYKKNHHGLSHVILSWFHTHEIHHEPY